jgi:predicted dehydrogenase
MPQQEKKVGFVTMGQASGEAKPIKDIGVGMLGYAFMGKAHSNAYQRMPFFFYPPPAKPRLVVICGRNKQAVEEAARRYGYARAVTDWKQVISDPEVQLVDNGLPNNLHLDPCVEAAENGKNILCEKPLAMNHAEAKKMYEAAEKAKVKHMTAFNYRFIPAIQFARDLILRGEIGKVLQFRGVYLQEWIMDPKFPLVWRLRKDVAGAGALGDLGAHVLDLARFLVGEVSQVCGMTKTFISERPLPDDLKRTGKVDVDDAFISLLKFSNGAVGSVEASRFCAGRKNFQRIEIHGSEGTINFNLERLNELEIYKTSDPADERGFKTILVTESIHPYYDRWWPHGHTIGWEHATVHEVYHFIKCIVNDESVAPLGATFYDGMKNNQIMDAIVRSSERRTWEGTE